MLLDDKAAATVRNLMMDVPMRNEEGVMVGTKPS